MIMELTWSNCAQKWNKLEVNNVAQNGWELGQLVLKCYMVAEKVHSTVYIELTVQQNIDCDTIQ